MLELCRKRNTLSLPSLPGSLRPWVVASDRVISMGQIELNYVLMLIWIAWNRTVLIFKLRNYAELSFLKLNSFCILNWFVWNRTVFKIETVLTWNSIVWNRTVLTFNLCTQKLYLYWFVWIRTVWLSWIAWNKNVFTIKLCTYAKLNCLK